MLGRQALGKGALGKSPSSSAGGGGGSTRMIVRLGDTSTHGGAVTTAAAISWCEGARIARIGDILTCAIHGVQPIVGGSSNSLCEGAGIARHGDAAACGALLLSGATKSPVN